MTQKYACIDSQHSTSHPSKSIKKCASESTGGRPTCFARVLCVLFVLSILGRAKVSRAGTVQPVAASGLSGAMHAGLQMLLMLGPVARACPGPQFIRCSVTCDPTRPRVPQASGACA